MAYTYFDRLVAWRRFRAALPHVRPQSRVCDVGCGLDAAFLTYARSRVRFGLGLDYQPLRPINGGGALVQCDISQSVPVRSGEFDHAVMLAVLEHLDDPKPLLHELFRILAPGGSLVMTWPKGVVDHLLRFLHGIGLISKEMETEKHRTRIPVACLVEMLRTVGFINFEHKRFELGLNNLLVCYKPLRAPCAEP